MTIDLFKVFLIGLALMAGIIVIRWIVAALSGLAAVFPSHAHSQGYNLAAWAMIVLAVYGLVRLIRTR